MLVSTEGTGLSQTALKGVFIIIVFGIIKLCLRLYQVRKLFRDIPNKYGIPILPHSFLFGHIPIVIKVMSSHPKDIYGNYLPMLLRQEYPDICSRGLVYVDVWPLGYPLLAVFDPGLMSQFTQVQSQPKHEHIRRQFEPFTQGQDLLVAEGEQWSKWRRIFNPGFSAKNIVPCIPAILEEIEVFRDWLKEAARSGETVTLEQQSEKLTVDVISRIVLGSRLHSQTEQNSFYSAMRNQTSWLSVDNQPLGFLATMLNPIRPIALWRNNITMKSFLLPHIQKVLRQKEKEHGPETILSLAIQSYTVQDEPTLRDSNFIDVLVAQLKIFMFAGHETTAGILCYLYHILYSNPTILDTMRREHDSIFGLDLATTSAKIKDNPTLLNKLPYTSAVIKETLRLFTPAGTVRAGSPDFFLRQPETGERYPTNGMMVYGCSSATHRDEAFWPEPGRCIPERWLVPEGDFLHPQKNAYRPFELGPRNCIGQETAQLELRAIMVMTVREFDIESQFPADGPRMFGEVAYQTYKVGKIIPQPRNDMPVRVMLRTS
ncbi:cytochrome P450 [Talaromyces proteolyticus]|uniref:Cytochrome P450 n=1 Tax=Talaromyces proteolyticus TaxID=1131652 RepID=A0AAD4Q3V2_9EURO|nr:cytochrome P450 [Talaromyces proteolyticus]KAH8702111.1 cytochrome P450 [Talaromyces proteolyticus]